MLEKVIELQVPLLHQNVTEYSVNLSFKKVIDYIFEYLEHSS